VKRRRELSIYLDAVLLLNILFDFMLLLLTNTLAKLNTKKLRLFIGALLASLIVPLSIFNPDHFITSPFGKILFSIFIILAAFGFKNIYRMFKLLFLFYFVNFSIGGGLVAIHFFLQNPVTLTNTGFFTYNTGFGDPISWIFIAVSFPVAWLFTKQRMDKHVQEKIRYDAFYPVTIQINKQSFSTNGYIDSGNQLVDPFTKKPVIICDEFFLEQWFEKEDWTQLKNAYHNWDMDSIPRQWVDYIHIIPFQGVEGGNGFIFAIKPDSLSIHYDMHQIQTSHFLVGIQFGQLTKDESYHCLLQPELIQSAAGYSA